MSPKHGGEVHWAQHAYGSLQVTYVRLVLPILCISFVPFTEKYHRYQQL